MIAPDHMLAATIAESLKRPPQRMRRLEYQRAIAGALDAWKRVRVELFSGVRRIA
jgi:hypothetical protein